MGNLQVLNLSGTKLTNTGLTSLLGLTKLYNLCASGSRVTDAGKAEFTARHPRVKTIH